MELVKSNYQTTTYPLDRRVQTGGVAAGSARMSYQYAPCAMAHNCRAFMVCIEHVVVPWPVKPTKRVQVSLHTPFQVVIE